MTDTPARILVVEDSPTQAQVLAMHLEEAGLDVTVANDAERAVACLREATFELLLTNLTLPGSSGIDLCRAAKREWPNLPVIVLTGSGDVENVLLGLHAGADGFLVKSRSTGELVERITATLARPPEPDDTPRIVRTTVLRGETIELSVSPHQLFDVLLSAVDDLGQLQRQHEDVHIRLEDEHGQRRRLEKDLQDSRAIYESLVENVPVSLFRKDREGRFTFANQPFCRELGKTPEEIVGRTDFDFFPAHLARKYRKNDAQVMDSGEVFEDVEAHRTPEGNELFVQVLKAPVLDSENELVGIQCVFWDVTDRETARRELRASEARKQAIFEASLDAMIIADADWRIVEFNRAAARIFGYRRSQVLGEPMDELLFPPEAKEAARRKLEDGATDEPNGRHDDADHDDGTDTESLVGERRELELVRRNGETFIAEIVTQRITFGRTVQYATVLHDITDRKQAERELREAKETAESANRAKSNFLANMSHEIRTPMNAVIGMTELVLGTELTAGQREHLDIVHDAAESLLDLINDILDFSKIEAGRLDLDAEPFALRERIGDTMKTLATRAHGKELELACRIHPDVPDAIQGDSGRLRQIVVNLVGNAVKFTQEGEVVLEVDVAEHEPEAVVLRFSVRDTGIGIPPEKQRAIFEAFEQADASTTRKFGGTGLGLAISSSLAALMDGGLTVESEPGVGSTFSFTGRFALADPERVRELRREPRSIRGLSVLVVDDNETNRRILDEMLTSWELRPVVADGAERALALLREHAERNEPFDVVISDVNMPIADGFDFVERLRAEGLAPKAILMLTSADRPGDVQRCRELGVSRYMTKPAKQSELLDAIESAVGLPVVSGTTTPPERERPRTRSLRILLAEDSKTNQILAKTLLEQEGHEVTIACNGVEAVATYEAERFDLVLMDVQMPEMDGFEATATIREHEDRVGRRTPIVAMTAHAMQGDRERCLEAGMDGYVAKPIRTAELFEVVASMIDVAGESPSNGVDEEGPTGANAGANAGDASGPGGEPTPDAGPPSVDWDSALSMVGGDPQLLAVVIEAALEECPAFLDRLGDAIAAGDARVARRSAHSIHGTLRTFGCPSVITVAREIETEAGAERLAGLDAKYEVLQTRLERTFAELRAYDPANGPR